MKIKSLPRMVAAICIIFCCSIVIARAQDEADRAALRLIRTNYMEAVNSGDLSKLALNLDKEVTGVMVTGEEVKGLDGLKAYWTKIQNLIGPGGSYRVTVNVDKTDIFNDLAVSRGKTDDVVQLPTGKELRFNSYWTAICRKEDGVWKAVRLHAAMDPVDNVFVSLQLQKAKLLYGIGGCVVGAVLMFVIRWPRGRQAVKQVS